MKKLLVSLLAVAMLTVSLTGCTAAKVYKYGLGTVIAVSGSAAVAAVGETAAVVGKYGVNVDVVSVVVDKDGKIVSATWDVAQASNLKFDDLGALKADPASYVKTKAEKGADYGMKGNSAIGKEWFEQAAFMTDYVVGMTLAEVQAIAITDGYATDADIKAGASIHINAFQAALVEAMQNATEVKKVASYGIGHIIAVTGSAAVAAAGETAAVDGKYGVNVDLVTVALDKDGKILSVIWDVAQASNLKFDATGALKADPASYVKTKAEKGADYGMKGNSAIGKEWFEQAAFMAEYVVGKTLAEVQAIAITDGYATDADIKAGASIHINAFQAALVEAMQNAADVK